MKKILAAVACLSPMLANALPITIDWTGSITRYVEYSSAGGANDVSLDDGYISGSVTYDPDVFGGLSAAPWGEWLLIAGADTPDFIQTTTQWQNGTFIPNAAATPTWDVFRANDNPTPPGWEPQPDALLFQDQQNDGTVIEYLHLSFLAPEMLGAGPGSNSSPYTIPDFSLGVMGWGLLQWQTGPHYDGFGYYADFMITSAAVRPVDVPEPSVVALFCVGLLGFAIWRRRSGAPV